ncbi:MAG: hypothetical protein J0H08_08775 [Rhizobiales bacterium]|nr:hypothetical protein [Hyphomicrobiales bacterium]
MTATVFDAIKAFLGSADVTDAIEDPSTATVPPIRFENERFEKPNPPAPWIAMALTGVVYGQQSIGAGQQSDNRWDEAGDLWLQVHVPSGSGASRAWELARVLADQFRGLRLMSDDLEFMDAFIGQGGPAEEEGNWFMLPLSIEWRRVDA